MITLKIIGPKASIVSINPPQVPRKGEKIDMGYDIPLQTVTDIVWKFPEGQNTTTVEITVE